MSENYQLVYQSRRKCEIYRDTGVSKNPIVLYTKSLKWLIILFFTSMTSRTIADV